MKTIAELAKELDKNESEFIVRTTGIIEWICKHGVGHPVEIPEQHKSWGGIHGCDGCCSTLWITKKINELEKDKI